MSQPGPDLATSGRKGAQGAPDSRLLLLAGLTFLLLLAGLASLSRGVLALALPLVVYLAVALLSAPGNLRLEAHRTVTPERTFGGHPVLIRLTLVNRGPALEHIEIRDQVPPSLTVERGEPYAVAALGPGERLELEYCVSADRGHYRFSGATVSAGGWPGFSGREATVPAPGNLVVLPEVMRLRRLPLRPARTRGHTGPVPARLGGPGTDFFGVREYVIGDPQRWINWRASARHPGTLYTNQFQQERIADVGIILDARVRTDVLAGGESLFEHAVRATATLADVFLRDGNRVGLLVFGQYLDWTFPGYGKVQRERILRALARAQQGDSQVFEKLDYLPTRFFPAKSQIVLVSPVAKEDLPALVRLRALGYQLMVIRPDPVSFELRGLARQTSEGRRARVERSEGPSDPAFELAARILRVERLLVRRWLRQAGIQVVDWQVHLPFDQAVHASLGRMTQWIRMAERTQ